MGNKLSENQFHKKEKKINFPNAIQSFCILYILLKFFLICRLRRLVYELPRNVAVSQRTEGHFHA